MVDLVCTHDGAEHGPYRSVCDACLREYAWRVRREALEDAGLAAASEQLYWRHSNQAWSACAYIASRIRALAASPKEET